MSPETQIPALDLSRAVARFRPEVEARWQRLLGANAFVGGAEVQEFEDGFAKYLGSGGCVGVANGTDALIVALRALGVGPGDEVIVPAFTFVATAAAVALVGGTPVFADVEATSLNLSSESVAERLTPNTVGVIGVHLYGCPFDVQAIGRLCEQRGLWLVEDAAQAQGAAVGNIRVGNFGHLAAWSFYPTKNLGAFGDAGAITGNDVDLLAKVRRQANHGAVGRYQHAEVGTNSRLDALQAAVLNCRLPKLEEDNARRRASAEIYDVGLGDIDELGLLRVPEGAVSVYHQYTVLTERRDELAAFLAERGIGTAVHYPEALHLQEAFSHLPRVELPIATGAGARALCLPMYPELEESEAQAVVEGVRRFFG